MAHVPLGPLSVSRVGLGCNNFGRRIDLARTREVVDAALDAGIDFFDTADIYGDGDSERFLGELLQGRRDRVVLATKFGHDTGGARDSVRRGLEASLQRLRTDRVDLLYYHRPDGVTPIAETIGAMAELVGEGNVRAIGVSNFDVEQLDEAARTADVAALQNEYSLLRRDAGRDVLPRCRELGVGFVPYFPLASGLLTGKYRRGEPLPEGTRLAARGATISDEQFDELERLETLARDRGATLLDLAIGWLASQEGIASVIAGATSAEQVRANAAAGSFRLSQNELALV